jgi:hypothetical protein
MPEDKVFDAGSTKYDRTEVWVYVSNNPEGICYALPRILPGGAINLLGMICQGKASGKACFWDNKEPVTNNPVTPVNGLDPAKLAGGDTLEEKCVDCHRGDNAFVITPGTPLQRDDDKTDVDNPPYGPISTMPPREGWINEPVPPPGTKPVPPAVTGTMPTSLSPKLAGDGSGCQSCHAIPKVTIKYCGLVRKMVENKIMPPGGGTMSAAEKADVEGIKRACNELKPGTWPSPP